MSLRLYVKQGEAIPANPSIRTVDIEEYILELITKMRSAEDKLNGLRFSKDKVKLTVL